MKNLRVLILFLVCVTTVSAQDVISSDGVISGNGEDIDILEIRTPHNLVCNVEVRSHASGKIEGQYWLTVNAKNAEQENRYLKLISTSYSQSKNDGNGIARIELLTPTLAPWEGTSNSVSAELIINIPAKMNVDIRNMYGEVSVYGPFRKVKIDKEYGSIHIRDVNEETIINTSYSDIEVYSLKGILNIESSYSNILASDIVITNEMGIIRNAYGKLDLKDIIGPINASTTNDDITAESIKTDNGSISLITDYGNIIAKDLSGELVIESSYGLIELDEIYLAYGKSKIETSYSPINAIVYGMADTELSLNNTYNSINLILPSNISTKLSLSVDDGGTIHTKGLSIRPLVMESNRLVGVIGSEIGIIDANIDGIGEINIIGE